MKNIEKDIYTVYDRLSKRHDWQGIASRESKKLAEKVIDDQCAIMLKSKTAKKYPDYQIGILKEKFKPFGDSYLPKNTKMDKVLDVNACIKRIQFE